MGLSGSSQKQNTNNTTASTYGYETPPSTPDLDILRNHKFEVDPGLAAQYGRQRSDLNRSFAQPTGAFQPQAVRDAQLRSGMERLGRDEAQAGREGAYDVNRLNFGREATVAGMSAPQLVQRSSTSTGSGTVTQTPSAFSTALQAGSALAPLSL